MLFPVLYMEAAINRRKLSIECFHGVKSEKKRKKKKKMQCSPLVSKLMRATNCVQLSLNPFCREVREGCLTHVKNDSDRTVHKMQLAEVYTQQAVCLCLCKFPTRKAGLLHSWRCDLCRMAVFYFMVTLSFCGENVLCTDIKVKISYNIMHKFE